jgi:hypothetical protein
MQIKASTPEQMKAAIVKLIDGWASNERIKSSNAIHSGVRKDADAKALAYEGAARLIEKLEIVQ